MNLEEIIYAYNNGGLRWACELENRLSNAKYLEQYGYKIYSQNDEDGIVEEIFRRIGTKSKYFVEFGVQDGMESNCHSLLLKNWNGIWIEGNTKSFERIRELFSGAISSGQLKVLNEFITKDNIESILVNHIGEHQDVDVLSIDIDGNDYYVWESIKSINPRVVIIEYNAKLGPSIDWVMPYDDNYVWDGSDYFGASLMAYERLGKEKGYKLVGTNVTGVNAFFVREDLAEDLFVEISDCSQLFNPPRYKYSGVSIGHRSFQYLGNAQQRYRKDKTISVDDGQVKIVNSNLSNTKSYIIYGYGVAGKKLLRLLKNAGYKIDAVCDKYKCGTYEEGMYIFSLDELIGKYKLSNYIISIQNKALLKDVITNLLNKGIDMTQIYIYDEADSSVF